jgi:L-alanine-DL-glutamate epimerase-like enolase superfamily enzyme
MSEIVDVRSVLLSAPYAHEDNLEVQAHLSTDHRTCGFIEVTLDDGTTGLGEGYLPVFAPHVFEAIVELVGSYLTGKDATDIAARHHDLRQICDYWSRQGAARHIISACEIALVDAKAKQLGVPAYDLFGGKAVDSVRLYGSGGDSVTPTDMAAEFDLLVESGIDRFKIRALTTQPEKAAWTLEQAAERGIDVGIDMTQSLADPAQKVPDVVRFLDSVREHTEERIAFLEDPLNPFDTDGYRLLRRKVDPKIAGGETITTSRELNRQIRAGMFDIAQPDATVIGGIREVLNVFRTANENGAETVVHCWGGPASLLANYHAAFAGGGRLAEWPMPQYPLREEMLVAPLDIEDGCLNAPSAPGLGVELSEDIESSYEFREDAIYSCLPNADEQIDEGVWD